MLKIVKKMFIIHNIAMCKQCSSPLELMHYNFRTSGINNELHSAL